ncbi:MAG TPA: GIY-YIG nuclease family protein [Gammaproteobacteria bacterium]|jgi:putative endonuclease|nr:GIY-YIG nuclease family protein [Gammaproteobacteria bacterium]
MVKQFYWVYILYCENGHYYTGYTVDLKRRYAYHLIGKGSKYTRSFKPLKISQSWKIKGDKLLAMKLEHFIKSLTRPEKEILILNPKKLIPQYKNYRKNIDANKNNKSNRP